KRVTEVLDSWIEAGSASFAERHFPFEKSEKLEDFFPPDFIAEYTGQIRAWFYVLHVIGAILYESPAFKNVVVEGVILGTDGRKMSKNYGNYPDPKDLLEKYGGDALRLYLMSSPVVMGEDMVISEESYRLQVRGMMLILWNVYNFFVTYATADKFEARNSKFETSENVLDQWIVSLLNKLIQDVTESLKKYDTVFAIESIKKFIDDLSTWYIRRSRDRVGTSAENEEDKNAFYQTCYEVLTTLCKILAPITPFLAEEMYINLTGEESVHLTEWPIANKALINKNIEREMVQARMVVEKAHAARKEAGIKVRQPLSSLATLTPVPLSETVSLIKDEVNVVDFENKKGDFYLSLDTNLTDELIAAGKSRDIIRQIQEERKKLGTSLAEKVNVTLPDWPEEFENEIKKKALVQNLEKGDKFSVSRVS
ncbi:MAG TPA: class I tRNA ligase family protein, partial [Candidatus Saccharimonadales bacterium]|nr:class I tRNA ligase family protein [Candidatus Saccharimonadales bacterium]